MQCRGFEKVKHLRQLENVLLSYEESPSQLRDAGRHDRNGFEEDVDEHELQERDVRGRAENQRDIRFLRGRHIAHMTSEYFRFRSTNESVAELSDLMSTTFSGDDVQRLDAKWDGVPSSVREASKDEHIQDTEEKNMQPSYTRLKKMVKGTSIR